MAILRMCPNAQHIKEFYGRPGKPVYHGTCGEDAVATAMASAAGGPSTHDGLVDYMLDITEYLISQKAAEPSGATNMVHLRDEAVRQHFPILAVNTYQKPLPSDWLHTLLQEHAGVHPIIIEIAEAHNLKDTQGSADEPGVHYHFIAVLGLAEGDVYICADGDNPAVESRFSGYTWPILESAVPCAVLVLDYRAGSYPNGRPSPEAEAARWNGTSQMALSLTDAMVARYFEASGDAWKCKQTGHFIHGQILNFYRTMPAATQYAGLSNLGLPLTDEVVITTDKIKEADHVVYQRFERGTLVYDPKRLLDLPPGWKGDTYFAHLDQGPTAMTGDTSGMQTQLTQTKQALTTTQDQLTAANKKIAAATAALK